MWVPQGGFGYVRIVRNCNIPKRSPAAKKIDFKPGVATDRPHTTLSALPCKMTDYPAPETLSHQDLGPVLDKLRLLLENLPDQLPSKALSGPDASRYASFVGFQPDEELLEMTGSRAGALNMHLEHVFGHAARSTGDGVISILERGPPVCAIHNILKEYCAEFPDDNMLKKWVVDVAKGAEKVYNTHQITVSRIFEFINKLPRT
jgi:hypothetical protein